MRAHMCVCVLVKNQNRKLKVYALGRFLNTDYRTRSHKDFMNFLSIKKTARMSRFSI